MSIMFVKKRNIYFYIFFIFQCIQNIEFTDGSAYRRPHAVVYPPSTVIQFSLGLAVPAQVPNRSIFTNLGTINNVPLPSNISQMYSPIRTKRALRKFTHQDLYNLLEDIFDSWSFKSIIGPRKPRDTLINEEKRSTDCVQRTICHLASLQSSLDNQPELLFQMLKFLFLPSRNGYFEANSLYLSAEQYGAQLSIQECTSTYPSCPLSPLEMILNIN